MKIGLDIHGTIDRYPKEFALLTKRWVKSCGYEVHIMTGSPWFQAVDQVKDMTYTHHFSIVDFNRDIGMTMTLTEKGWWMSDEAWNRSKGDYATLMKLDVHFEDTLAYAPWFPSSCHFIHVSQRFDMMTDFITDVFSCFEFH